MPDEPDDLVPQLGAALAARLAILYRDEEFLLAELERARLEFAAFRRRLDSARGEIVMLQELQRTVPAPG